MSISDTHEHPLSVQHVYMDGLFLGGKKIHGCGELLLQGVIKVLQISLKSRQMLFGNKEAYLTKLLTLVTSENTRPHN